MELILAAREAFRAGTPLAAALSSAGLRTIGGMSGRFAMYLHRVRNDEPSPLTDDESALLDALLSHDFPGVTELRDQAQHVLAKRGCQCGCGTIDFVPDATPVPRSRTANPAPVEGVVRNADGEDVGGLILFVKDGMLQSLEICSYAPEPLPLPLLDQVTWRS